MLVNKFSIVVASMVVFINSQQIVSKPSVYSFDKKLLVELVNTQRQKGCKCGSKYYPPVNKVVWSETLEKVALLHSRDMEQKNYFSHTGKDGSTTPQRMERLGYNWMSYGENIYRTIGYEATEKEVIDAWIKSPGHCSNLMSENFKEMGIARSGNYWTQVFGSPMPK